MRSKISVSSSQIPIRNIWLLILFASKLYTEFDYFNKHYRTGSVEDVLDDIVPFVATLLINATERRLRRELNHHFERKNAELTRVRGRINLLSTERKQLLQKGRVSCLFFELSVNTGFNRYVKSALKRAYQFLMQQKQIPAHYKKVAQRCRNLATTMNLLGVVGAKPLLTTERELLLHRHDRDERLMYFASTLIHDLDIPATDSNDYWLWSTREDEQFLRILFERAVAGFYKTRLKGSRWKVRQQVHLKWPASNRSDGISEWLPSMQKDVDLVNSENGHQIIIDTKFNEILTKNRYDEYKLRSKDMYQIYSYIKTQEDSKDAFIRKTDGLLLHPAIDQTIDEFAFIQGHCLRFRTVDLTQSSESIQSELLAIIEKWPGSERD